MHRRRNDLVVVVVVQGRIVALALAMLAAVILRLVTQIPSRHPLRLVHALQEQEGALLFDAVLCRRQGDESRPSDLVS